MLCVTNERKTNLKNRIEINEQKHQKDMYKIYGMPHRTNIWFGNGNERNNTENRIV